MWLEVCFIVKGRDVASPPFKLSRRVFLFFLSFFEDVGMKNCLAKSDQKSVSGSNKPTQPCVLAAAELCRLLSPRPSHAHGLLPPSSPRKVKHFFIYFAA